MSITIEETTLIQKLNKFEVQCITGNFIAGDFQIDIERYKFSNEYQLLQDLDTLMKNISNHEYKRALQTNSEFFKPFKDTCKDLTLVFYEMYSQMKSNYQYLFHSGNDDCSYVKQLILLLVGVSALQEFVKVNICGPVLTDSTLHEICASFLPNSHFSNDSVLNSLGQNGEVILTKIAHPKLLFLSLMLLFGNNFDKCLTHKWWLSRCMMVHQKILPDNSLSLYSSISSLIHSQAEVSFLNDKSEPLASFMFNCECAQFFMIYNELNVAERYIINAQNILGIGVKLTKSCVRNLDKLSDQRCVIVKRNDERYQSVLTTYDNCIFPNYHFEPSNRWGKNIILLNHDGEEIDELLPEEQMILLLYCHLLMRRKYDSDSTFYDDLAILDCLISKPKIWSLQMKALISRCIRNGYVGDEHINQVNELINHYTHDISAFSHKLVLFYCVSLPMIYNIHKLLADVLFRRGNLIEAASIYRKFHLWKGSINCYKHLNIVSTGVDVLEEMIAAKPSSLLWCYLGNLRDEYEIYQVAWNLSYHSNARAARYTGFFFYKHQVYNTSIFHFKESLELNPKQPNVLLHMGHAAMAIGDFTLAIEAFNGILEMDVDNCEAWAYLCKAFIKTDDKVNACRCFTEIMTFEGEKMEKVRNKFWENYLLISAKIGAFSDIISGFHYFLNESFSLKDLSSSDVEVLKILVNAIRNETPDINQVFSPELKTNGLELFERITSRKCNNPIIWELYSVLLSIEADFRNNITNTERIISCQQKAIRYYVSQVENDRSVYEALLKLLLKCLNLFDIYAKNLTSKLGLQAKEIVRYNNFQKFLIETVRKVKKILPLDPKSCHLLWVVERKFQCIM